MQLLISREPIRLRLSWNRLRVTSNSTNSEDGPLNVESVKTKKTLATTLPLRETRYQGRRKSMMAFSRESNPGTVEFALAVEMLLMKCQNRAGPNKPPARWWQKAQSGAAREKTLGARARSARVQAATTRRQQNRHSKRCKKRDRSSSVSTTGRQQSSRVLFRAVAAMAHDSIYYFRFDDERLTHTRGCTQR